MKVLSYISFFLIIVMFSTSCSSDNNSNDSQSDPNTSGEPDPNTDASGELDLSEAEKIKLFPDDHPLNRDISNEAVDPNSDLILNNIGRDKGIFADFGSGLYQGAPVGIPYVVVNNSQPEVPITFRGNNYDGNYESESDKGPFPIPLTAPIEGNGAGDSHVISINVESKKLYELYNTNQVGNGFEVSSAAVFDLNSGAFRPDGWTSADAAGLPIFPLLIRYPEIEEKVIDHPIRFTISRSKIYEGYVHPARHLVSGNRADNLLPLGGRLRLKSDFDISGFSETNQIILTAMKKYGLILADVGSSMFITGAPHDSWDNEDLRRLREVTLNDFEVIELGEIKTAN